VEWGRRDLHKVVDLGPEFRPRLPYTETQLLEFLLPAIEATDLSHPRLAEFREALSTIGWRDADGRPPLTEYVEYLRALLARLTPSADAIE
jgi:hypothetical protein